jgi:hypothetical protein
MHTFKKVFLLVLLTVSMSSMQLTAFADPGKGKGQGNAQGKGRAMGHTKGHGKTQGKQVKSKSMKATPTQKTNKSAVFSATDKTTIENYVKQNPMSAKALPPGIAMNVARGKPLPPGIAKRNLSPELVSILPVRPGYEYVAVGNDVALVNSNTNVVADIISNVLK